MGIPAQSRWWVFTLLIVGVLVLISALALHRPNVAWLDGVPLCPHCRHQVELYSNRCAECGAEFDWRIPTREESPLSPYSLSAQEADWIRDRVQELGLEDAAKRVAASTGLSTDAAEAYLGSVGRGDCGWCGGTQRDLSQPIGDTLVVCPACLGTGHAVDCGADGHVGLGHQSAAQALVLYIRHMESVARSMVPLEVKRRDAKQLAETFLSSHEGTGEAEQLIFWPMLGSELQRDKEHTIVWNCRQRLNKVLTALREGQ